MKQKPIVINHKATNASKVQHQSKSFPFDNALPLVFHFHFCRTLRKIVLCSFTQISFIFKHSRNNKKLSFFSLLEYLPALRRLLQTLFDKANNYTFTKQMIQSRIVLIFCNKSDGRFQTMRSQF